MNEIITQIDQWLDEHDTELMRVPSVTHEQFVLFHTELAEQHDAVSLRAALAHYHCRANQHGTMHVYKALPTNTARREVRR